MYSSRMFGGTYFFQSTWHSIYFRVPLWPLPYFVSNSRNKEKNKSPLAIPSRYFKIFYATNWKAIYFFASCHFTASALKLLNWNAHFEYLKRRENAFSASILVVIFSTLTLFKILFASMHQLIWSFLDRECIWGPSSWCGG